MTKQVALDNTWKKLNTTAADVLITGANGPRSFSLAISKAAPGADEVGHTITQAMVLPKGTPAYIRSAGGIDVWVSAFDGSDPTA